MCIRDRMNSARASPTPLFGSIDRRNAWPGSPTISMIFVRVSGTCDASTWSTTKGMVPWYTRPSAPSAQQTVISSPSCSRRVAFPVPTMQGRPNSRDTIAAWAVLPPLSVTIAATRRITGSQVGIGDLGDEDVAGLHGGQTAHVTHDTDAPCADPFAHRLAAHDWRSWIRSESI